MVSKPPLRTEDTEALRLSAFFREYSIRGRSQSTPTRLLICSGTSRVVVDRRLSGSLITIERARSISPIQFGSKTMEGFIRRSSRLYLDKMFFTQLQTEPPLKQQHQTVLFFPTGQFMIRISPKKSFFRRKPSTYNFRM